MLRIWRCSVSESLCVPQCFIDYVWVNPCRCLHVQGFRINPNFSWQLLPPDDARGFQWLRLLANLIACLQMFPILVHVLQAYRIGSLPMTNIRSPAQHLAFTLLFSESNNWLSKEIQLRASRIFFPRDCLVFFAGWALRPCWYEEPLGHSALGFLNPTRHGKTSRDETISIPVYYSYRNKNVLASCCCSSLECVQLGEHIVGALPWSETKMCFRARGVVFDFRKLSLRDQRRCIIRNAVYIATFIVSILQVDLTRPSDGSSEETASAFDSEGHHRGRSLICW